MLSKRRVLYWLATILAPMSASTRADVFHLPFGLTSIEFVSVGNPGNAPDTRYDMDHAGAVPYPYQIGKFEVTAAQYTEFLNAVARTDTYGLYDPLMGEETPWDGCNIQQSGSPGNYTYSVAPDSANRPVNYVSWLDALRFANWLQNGQPTGPQDSSTTEDGSYLLDGATVYKYLPRKAGARYVLPTPEEWYKAAFHKNDGVTGNYWRYPTGTDTPPSNILADPDPGNNANFNPRWAEPPFRTPVGAFENSASPYGTFDQAGNVQEWSDTWDDGVYTLGSSYWDDVESQHARWSLMVLVMGDGVDSVLGFRVATVPEPGTLPMLLTGGCLALLLCRRIRARCAKRADR